MLLKIETNTASDGGAAVRTTWASTCNTCCAAPSTVYCYTDLAYLCAGCDARIHAAALHYRVGVCDSCERAPSAFLCKADSASLCAACDADIHSANPLARRHYRVPVQPTLFGPLAANHGGLLISPSENAEDEFLCGDIEEDEDEAASWLLLNPIKNDDDDDDDELSTDANAPPLFGGEVDEYLDLDDYNSCENKQFNEGCNNQQQHYSVPQISYGGDSVVPIQYQKGKNHSHNLCFDLAYTYPASISQTVSISSLDVGVVPESTSEVSMSYTGAHKGTNDQFLISPPMQMPAQLSPMDREARVVRYREKKKMRKFEKTIRYASRKAYAETRPRIKGRFAKRRDAEFEVDQMFTSASLMLDTAYGVVPSF